MQRAVSWLVYAVAVVAFALGSQDKVGAADSVALVLVAISLSCSLQEQRCFGADLAGKSLLDYLLSPEDHHSFLLLLHSELWQLRSIIVRRVRNLCVSARGRFRF